MEQSLMYIYTHTQDFAKILQDEKYGHVFDKWVDDSVGCMSQAGPLPLPLPPPLPLPLPLYLLRTLSSNSRARARTHTHMHAYTCTTQPAPSLLGVDQRAGVGEGAAEGKARLVELLELLACSVMTNRAAARRTLL